MNKLYTFFAITSFSLLTACSSSPERVSDNAQGDPDVTQDTAPGLNGDGGVEVLPAGKDGSGTGVQDLGSSSATDIEMVDVNTIYEPVIYFAYDQYQLDDKGTDNIRYHADILMANPNQKVVLYGHTDERGTPEYNLALGEKRAKSVEQAMMLFGVNQDRIEVVTYGEEQPADPASNEEAWQKNRRVEIIIK